MSGRRTLRDVLGDTGDLNDFLVGVPDQESPDMHAAHGSVRPDDPALQVDAATAQVPRFAANSRQVLGMDRRKQLFESIPGGQALAGDRFPRRIDVSDQVASDFPYPERVGQAGGYLAEQRLAVLEAGGPFLESQFGTAGTALG